MPDKFSQLGFTEGKAAQAGDFKSLGFAPAPAPAPDAQPGFLKEAAAIPAGGLQEFGRLFAGTPTTKIGKIIQAIPGSKFSLGALAKLAASRPQAQQILQQSPTLGKVGGGLADISAFAGTSGLAAPLAATIGGGGLLGTLGRAAIRGFPAGAAVSPGARLKGGLLGSLLEPAAVGAGKALKTIPKMDVVLRSRLGKRVISGFKKVTDKATELYDTAFEGTEGITPELTNETQANVNELKERFPGARGNVPRSIKAYEGNKSLQNLHFLRSNLGDEWQRLEVKRRTPGSVFTKEDSADQEAISDTRKNISKSLENNFNKLNEDKKVQYDKAQRHFENKVAPFQQKGHTAIMKALSPDRDITNKLFTEIGADSVKASKVRKVLGLSRPQLDAARLLRNKLITLPALGAALGTGLFLGGKKLL